MRSKSQSTMLELQTNLLAGMFVLFLLFTINASGGGNNEDIRNLAQGGDKNLSVIQYNEPTKRKKDLKISHIYIEIPTKKIGKFQFQLEGSPSILDSCTIVYSPFTNDRTTWSISRKGKAIGDWGVSVLNTSSLNDTLLAKIHVFNGTVHACSKEIKVSAKTNGRVINIIERANLPSKITIADDSCI